MAVKYPLILNNTKFLVNPTSLKVQMGTLMSTLTTQGGVKYYIWYNNPEVLTIQGQSAGDTAYQELTFLKNNYNNTNKLSTLTYKTTSYTGLITQMDVSATADNPNKFAYNITFQLIQDQQFKVEDFSLQATGLTATLLGYEQVAENYVNVQLQSGVKWVQDILGGKK